MIEPFYRNELVTLYCGDARTLFYEVQRSIDAQPVIVVTDPPYGIGYKPMVNKGKQLHKPIKGDDSLDLVLWTLDLDFPKVMWGAHEYWHLLPPGGRLWCWDKRTNANADRMFGHNFELAWGNIPGKKHLMIRAMHGGVVNADGHGVKRIHPTQKPVEVMRRIIEDCDPEALIIDPFAGSGSTLVAAMKEGRHSVGIEIDAGYCAAVAERLEAVNEQLL